MSEREVLATVNAGGERFEATKENLSVFRHIGKYALYNHCFLEINGNQGIYIWAEMEGHDDLASVAVENECALHLNIQEVADVDRKAFEKQAIKAFSIPDSLPDDFEA